MDRLLYYWLEKCERLTPGTNSYEQMLFNGVIHNLFKALYEQCGRPPCLATVTGANRGPSAVRFLFEQQIFRHKPRSYWL